ncbi:MAG: SpoIIE family protein phosphatase [Flavobacteriales bacterium]|nr:SpoIIE family protein phosphatase [Flavobacteriales bacterium]
MNKTTCVLALLISLILIKSGIAQNFTIEEQRKLDSLNAIINNPNSHDTSMANAYVGLSKLFHVSNIDTMMFLCTKAKSIVEKKLATHPPDKIALALRKSLSAALNNLGYVYENKGQIKNSLIYYQKALKIDEEIGDKYAMAYNLNNIGGVYLNRGQIENGLKYYHKSLKIREEIGDKTGMANSLNNIGIIYNNQGQIENALEYAHKGMLLAKELGFPKFIKSASELLYKLYKKQNKGMEALEMYQLYIAMRDSTNNLETQAIVIKQQTQYEYEKQKALDDAEHEKQLAIEKEAKAKQKVITFATVGGLILVAIFLVFVFNRLQVTRKQKNVIEEQKTVVEKAHHELEEKNKEIMDSITYAKRIQSAILPPTKLVKEYLRESFILYKPKDIVAGDFYWMEHKNGKILFAAADCTGHGVPGAMVSVVCNNGLNRSVREHGLTDPGKILDKTREIVIQEFEKSDEDVKDGMDISLCGLDLNNKTLSWSGANNPLWIIRNNEILEYKADKQPIGKYAESKPFTTHQIQLGKGDSIYIFTDGYQDQFGGEKGKKFKAAKLRELLLSIQHEPMEKQRELIDQAFEAWKGSLEQVDDVCVIGVRV